ncbi:MAG: PaaI family thioesterase [Anaerovoracaceae bacterium]|jgi:uncharacterized protein (TIGR00369 family)
MSYDEKEMIANKKMEEEFKVRINIMHERESGRPNGMIQPSLISCDAGKKEVTYEYPVLDWELNFKDVLHGGIMSLMFDLSMGLLANYYATGFSPTSNINVNFIKPAPKGDKLLVTARIISVGKRLVNVYAEAYLKSSGAMAANAFGTFAVTEMTTSFYAKI